MSTRVFVLPILLWMHEKDKEPRRIAIVNRGTLFKSALSSYEGKLKLFGGLVEEGEDEEAALIREVGEEIPELYHLVTNYLGSSKEEDSVFDLIYDGSHFQTIEVSDHSKSFTVRILHLIVNRCIHSTDHMYEYIAGVSEGNAEFYDIANRPFDPSEWVWFLQGLKETFDSYNPPSEKP